MQSKLEQINQSKVRTPNKFENFMSFRKTSKSQCKLLRHLEHLHDKHKTKVRNNQLRAKMESIEPQVRIATTGLEQRVMTAPPFLERPFAGIGSIVPQVGVSVELGLDSDAQDSIEGLTASIKAMQLKLDVSPELSSMFEKVITGLTKIQAEPMVLVHDVSFSTLSNPFSGVMEAIMPFLSLPVIAALVAVLVFMYYKGMITNGFAIGAFVGWLVGKFNLDNMASIVNFFTGAERVTTQSLGIEELSNMVVGICNSVLGCGAITGIFDVKPIYSYISASSRVGAGIKPMIEMFASFLSYIRYCIGKYLYQDPNAMFTTGYSYIDAYLTEFYDIRHMHEEKTLLNSDQSLDRVRAAISTGERIAMRLPSGRDGTMFKFRINETLAKLELIKKSLLATNFKYNGIRQEPVAILMRGPPGCGKSLTMQHLAHAIAGRTFSKEDLSKYKDQPSLFVYNRQHETVYWEGYDSLKKITFFDDICQSRDIAGQPDNEIMNVIRAINVFENQLHCAAMELKGNTTFRSLFVIANTNVVNFNFESINDKGAFLRRWNIVVDVCPKREFCTDDTMNGGVWSRKLDLSKLPSRSVEGVDTNYMDPSVLEFHQQVLSANDAYTPNGFVGTFDDLVNRVVTTYERKCRWHAIYETMLADTLSKYSDPPQTVEPNPPSEESVPDDIKNFTRPGVYEVGPAFNILKYSAHPKPTIPSGVRDFIQPGGPETRITSQVNMPQLDASPPQATGVVIIPRVDVTPPDNDAEVPPYRGVPSRSGVMAGINSFITPIVVPNTLNRRIFNASMASTFELMHRCNPERWQAMYAGYVYLAIYLQNEFSIELKPAHVALFDAAIADIPINQYSHEEYLLAAQSVMPGIIEIELTPIPHLNGPTAQVARATLDDAIRTMRPRSPIMIKLEDAYTAIRRFFTDDVGGAIFQVGRYALRANEIIDNNIAAHYYQYLFILGMWISQLTWASQVEHYVRVQDDHLKKLQSQLALMRKQGFSERALVSLQSEIDILEAEEVKKIIDSVKTKGVAVATPTVVQADVPVEQSNEKAVRAKRARVPVVKLQADVPPKREESSVLSVMQKFLPSNSASSQSLSKANPNVTDLLRSIARKNMYEFWAPIKRVGEVVSLSRYGFALVIRGRTIIMPYHFISELGSSLNDEKTIDLDCPIELRRVDASKQVYCMTVGDFFRLWKHDAELESHEIAYLRLPTSFPSAKNIVDSFVTDKRLMNYGIVDAVLSMPFCPTKELSQDKEIMITSAEQIQDLVVDNTLYDTFSIKRSFTYRAPTTSGDCGALLFADDSRGGPSILGMHVAGISANRIGYATILTTSLMENIIKKTGEDYVMLDQHNLELTPATSTINKVAIGKVSSQFVSSSSGNTKLIKSSLWGRWKKPLTAPAKLTKFFRSGELIDPMGIVLDKYEAPSVAIPDWIVQEASFSLEAYLLNKSSVYVDKNVFDFTQAVLGDGSSWFSAIPRNTSAGFPYTSYPGPKTKERFWGVEPDYDLSTSASKILEKEVDLIVRNANQGIRNLHLYVDFLKDERVSMRKSKEGITRLISGAPTSLSIVFRMYFGAFQKWIMANTISNGCAIVINEYGMQWDLLSRQLLHFGDNIGAGDFSSFDAHQLPVVHCAILDIINRWYDEPIGNRIRTILWMEVTHSFHLNGDTIYEWTSSLASGGPVTILVNCLYNQILFRMCWISIYGNVSGFNDSVVLKVTGDDHVYGAPINLTSTWNEAAIQSKMALFGMTYTPEDKSKDICDATLRTLREVSYLKRSFVWDETLRRWVAPLKLDVVLEIPFWVKDGAASTYDTERNLSVCFEELSLHSFEVFSEWKNNILACLEKVRIIRPPLDLDYFSLRRTVLSRELGSGYIQDSISKDPSFWLRVPANEFSDGKSGYTLSDGKSLRFYDYCQDGMRAALSISRSQNEPVGLVESQVNKSTATTNNNTKHVTFPPGLGDGSVFEPSSDSQASTGFSAISTTDSTTDGVTQEVSLIKHIPLDPQHLESADTGITQDVKAFLAKPYLLASGTFATTDAFPVNIYFQSDIYQYVLKTNTKWYNKLAGNYATRGTLVFTLFINGNRFQQGRYLMAWVPTGGCGFYNRALFIAGHSACLTQAVQLPHVEIDINLDSEARLSIPFVNAAGWCPFVTTTPTFLDVGALMIRTYSPLVSPTGSTTAPWALYVHIEDLEFKMPVVPQSGRNGVRTNRVPRTPVVDSEIKKSGPASSILSKVSKAANILTGVPLLSSIAAPVSWAADIGASLASVFGWSKPRVVADTTMVSRFVMPKYNNSDTKDTSVKLSVLDSNCVEEMTGWAGTDLDEMTLNYIASIPAVFNHFTWSTSDALGTLLMATPMSPKFFSVTNTYGGNTATFPVPMSFVSNFFSHYRGSIKLTFKIIKTEFHSGRLALSFYPFDYIGSNTAPANPSLANTEYLHRDIIDVREGTQFTFTIPYASLYPYHSIHGNDAPYGKVYLHVLNPLVAPSSVSSNVSIYVEASAAEDMEWAYPRSVQEIPTYVVTPQSGKLENEIVSGNLGFSNNFDSLAAARVAMGERVLSFRQLIKRFNPLILSNPGAINSYFQGYPYTIFMSTINAGNFLNQPECYPDIYSIIASCYALSRGSVRFKILDSAESDNKQMNCRNLPQDLGSLDCSTTNFTYVAGSPAVLGGYGNGDNNTFTYSGITSGLEVEFPYYSRMLAYATADVHNNNGVDLRYNMQTTAPRTLMDLSWSVNPSGTTFFRGAGEDFSLGLFVSVPGFLSWTNSSS